MTKLVLRPEAYYKREFSPLRYKLREWVMAERSREIVWLESIQKHIRSPLLASLCSKSAILGTHTFFMVFIPIWSFIGMDVFCRELLLTLALCVCTTGYVKDWLCIPRPESPRLKQSAMSTHALEYGFPSTHAATTMAMGFAFENVIAHNPLPPTLFFVWRFFLVLTAFSITFGRMYLGMHTFLDVSFGSLMGYVMWLLACHLRVVCDALLVTHPVSFFIVFYALTLVVPLCRMRVHDSCVCFDDTVAFVAAVAGVYFGYWFDPAAFVRSTPGQSMRTSHEVRLFFAIATAKFFAGVIYSVLVRPIAKYSSHYVFTRLFSLRTYPLSLRDSDHVKYLTKYVTYVSVGLLSVFMPIFFDAIGWSLP